MPTRRCLDCGLTFVLQNKRSYRCRPCQSKAVALQKLKSQRKRMDVRAHRGHYDLDISEAEIEARYQAGLREARSVQRDPETLVNFSWRYREPRS